MIELDTILAVVRDIFRVSLADLRGRRRFQRHMRARHAVAYLLVHAGYGVTEAGEMLERHYATVASSVAAADELARDDPTYAAQLRACQAALARSGPAAPRTVAATVAERRSSWIVAPSLHVSMFWWGIAEPPAA